MISPKTFSDSKEWEHVLNICRQVRDNGGIAYLVGGCVRDALKGKTLKDFDIEVFQLSEEKLHSLLEKNFKIDLVGKSYAVYKIKHYAIDVGLPRRETKIGKGHQAFDVESSPQMSVHEAASRRDFSINSIYYDPLNDNFCDPFGGIQDWENKILKHNTDKFKEDPLRPLRAMQFIARFGLDVAPETLLLCQEIQMEDLPQERIFEEWKKLLLQGVEIGKGLNFLIDSHWIRYFYELETLQTCPQEPCWHPEGSVWNHTCLCLDAFAKDRLNDEWEDLIVGLSVLLHDIGKSATTIISEGRIRSPKHDRLGHSLAENFLQKITANKKIFQEVLPLIQYHMIPHQLWSQKSSMSAVKRLSAKVKRLDRLIRVACADFNGRGDEHTNTILHAQWLSEKAHAASIIDAAPQPIVMGRHLIELGLKQSKIFKEILQKAYEAQMDEKFETLEEGLVYVQEEKSLKKYFQVAYTS